MINLFCFCSFAPAFFKKKVFSAAPKIAHPSSPEKAVGVFFMVVVCFGWEKKEKNRFFLFFLSGRSGDILVFFWDLVIFDFGFQLCGGGRGMGWWGVFVGGKVEKFRTSIFRLVPRPSLSRKQWHTFLQRKHYLIPKEGNPQEGKNLFFQNKKQKHKKRERERATTTNNAKKKTSHQCGYDWRNCCYLNKDHVAH